MRYEATRCNWNVGAVVRDTHTDKAICSCAFDDNTAIQIAAALNIVEKLPLSEDGVRIASNVDMVYQIDPKGMTNRPPSMFGPDPNPRPWSTMLSGVFFVPGLPFFSTEKTALASLQP